jgi:hypothetical protein
MDDNNGTSSEDSTDDDDEPASSGSIVSTVVPAVVVPVAVIGLVVAGFIWWRRRKNHSDDYHPAAPGPGYEGASGTVAGYGGAPGAGEGPVMQEQVGYAGGPNVYASTQASSYDPYGRASSSAWGSQPQLYGTDAGMQNPRLHNGMSASDPDSGRNHPSGDDASTMIGSSSAGVPEDIPAEAPPAYTLGPQSSAQPRGDRKQILRANNM